MFFIIQKNKVKKKGSWVLILFKQKNFVKKGKEEFYYREKNKNACGFFDLIFEKRYGSMFFDYALL